MSCAFNMECGGLELVSRSSTYQEEKDLALKMWRFLRDHPSVRCKTSLPSFITSKLAVYETKEPVCEVFKDWCDEEKPHNCPLQPCLDGEATYLAWYNAVTDEERKEAASKIVKRLEKWNGEI